MGVAVRISLLSCIRAEIYVMSYPLPVNGRHLRFTTYPDIGLHSQLFIPVVWSRKHGRSRWNFVAIMFTSWDIRNILSTSGHLLYDIPRQRTASLFLLRVLWHWTRVITFEIVLLSCILADIRVITKFQPPSWISDFRFHLRVLPTSPLKVWPRKHGGSRWNFVSS